MSAVSTVLLVMSREIRQRLRSKGFFVFTALLCVGIIAVGVLHRTLSDDGPTHYDLAVVGTSPDGFDQAIRDAAKSLGVDVRIDRPGVRADIEQQVRSGQLDVAVDPAHHELLSRSTPADQLLAVVESAWRVSTAQEAARAAGLNPAQIASILSPQPLTESHLVLSGHSNDDVARLVGTAAAVLLFLSINAFGGMVLTGVVEEKSTGVVEVLLSHLRAHQLLMGKVFGIGAVAMIQFAAALACGVVALRISGTTVPARVWVGLPTTLLWFVVGFVLYSTLFALAGSFVSRQEDAQGASAPISMVFTGAYLAVFVLGNSPYSLATRIISVTPPFAPLLMPLRVATGAASVFEIVLAAVLLLSSTYAMLRLAGAVYSRTLLHRGARLRWGEALKMLRS